MSLQGLAVVALLPLLAICREEVANLTLIGPPDHNLTNARPFAALAAPGNPASKQTYWQKCTCRGQKLTKASIFDKDKAIQFGTPLDTPFDSTLETELARWGYFERNEEANEKYCELFDMTLEGVLEGLGLEGHNECFWFQHNRGEKEPFPGESADGWVPVEQQTYRVDEKTY